MTRFIDLGRGKFSNTHRVYIGGGAAADEAASQRIQEGYRITNEPVHNRSYVEKQSINLYHK